MENLHFVQMQIIRELLFKPDSSFSDLNLSDLTSDHFAYHIKELVKNGYVEKGKDGYSLTNKGKKIGQDMDVDNFQIENRPKLSVFVFIHDNNRFLMQERKKSPFLGRLSYVAGKSRFGETVCESAIREAKEESGLDIYEPKAVSTVRQFQKDENGNILKDNLLCCLMTDKFSGTIREQKESRPFWVEHGDLEKLDNLIYDAIDLYNLIMDKNRPAFVQKEYVVEGY